MSTDQSKDRFFKLCSLYLDEQNSEDEAKELADLLRSSPELRLEMARLLRLHGTLTQRGAVSFDSEDRPKARRIRPRKARQGKSWFMPLAMAAGLLLTFGLLWSLGQSSEKEPRISVQPPKKIDSIKTPNPIPKPKIEPPIKDPEAPKPDPKPKTKVEPAPKVEPKPEPRPDPDPKPEPDPKPDPKPELDPEPTPVPSPSPKGTQDEPAPVICSVLRVFGRAKQNGKPLTIGTDIKSTVELTTETDSALILRYPDATICELGARAFARIDAVTPEALTIEEGPAEFSVTPRAPKDSLRIITPHSSLEVLGTIFKVVVGEQMTKISVTEGKVRLTRKRDAKSLLVRARYSAEAGKGSFRKRRLPKNRPLKETLLFKEDFEKSSLGLWPKSFKARKSENSGFEVRKSAGNKVMTCKGSNIIQRAYFPQERINTPFALRFRVRPSGPRNTRIGLNIWNETDKQRYVVAYDSQKSQFQIYYGEPQKLLAALPMQLEPGEWHDFEVAIKARSVKVSIAGHQRLTASTPCDFDVTGISVVSLGKDAAEFDDISLSQSSLR